MALASMRVSCLFVVVQRRCSIRLSPPFSLGGGEGGGGGEERGEKEGEGRREGEKWREGTYVREGLRKGKEGGRRKRWREGRKGRESVNVITRFFSIPVST